MSWNTKRVFTCEICGSEELFDKNEDTPEFPVIKITSGGKEIPFSHCIDCAHVIRKTLEKLGYVPPVENIWDD